MSIDVVDDLPQQVLDELGQGIADQVTEQVVDEISPSLNSMTPKEAVDKYFEVRDLKSSTKTNQKSSLYNFFVPWAENIAEIKNMNSLTGSDLQDFRVWRRDESSERTDKLSKPSQTSEQQILRKFIETCETFDAVRPGLHEYVIIPSMNEDEEVREEVLDTGTAEEILTWLSKYDYASIYHVTWLLFASCGARVGAIHSLDLDDYVHDGERAYLKFRHREDSGTKLKNGNSGERFVDIPESMAEVFDDYVNDKRVDRTDEYGRKPFLTTIHGRIAKSTLRNYVYAWTRPCKIGKECPYSREVDECEPAQRKNWASRCPDSLSPHPIRKGYITAELKAGVPKEILSERCDVSQEIMDKHYDFRTEEEKMEARRVAMNMAHDGKSGYAG